MAKGKDAAGFFDEPLLGHQRDAAVDAVEEVGALAMEAHLEDAEGALLFGANAKGGVGAARHVANLEGVDDALGIADVAKGIVFGVEQAEFLLERFEALGSIALLEQLAGFVVHRRYVVNALADGSDVQHTAACHHERVVLAKLLLEHR